MIGLLVASPFVAIVIFVASWIAAPTAEVTIQIVATEGDPFQVDSKQVVVTGDSVEGEPALGEESCGNQPLWVADPTKSGDKPTPTPKLADSAGKLLIPMLALGIDGRKVCLLQGTSRQVDELGLLAVDVRIGGTQAARSDRLDVTRREGNQGSVAFLNSVVVLVGFWGAGGVKEAGESLRTKLGS